MVLSYYTIVDLIHEMTHNGSILQNMDECVYYTIVDFIHEMTPNVFFFYPAKCGSMC